MLSSGYLYNGVHRHLGYNDTTVPLHTLFTGLVNLFECFRLELCPDLTNCTFKPNSVNVGLSWTQIGGDWLCVYCLSFVPTYPSSVPFLSLQAKAGQTAPKGKLRSSHCFFPLSKTGEILCTNMDIQYAKINTSTNQLCCWYQTLTVAPIPLQEKHFLNTGKHFLVLSVFYVEHIPYFNI